MRHYFPNRIRVRTALRSVRPCAARRMFHRDMPALLAPGNRHSPPRIAPASAAPVLRSRAARRHRRTCGIRKVHVRRGVGGGTRRAHPYCTSTTSPRHEEAVRLDGATAARRDRTARPRGDGALPPLRLGRSAVRPDADPAARSGGPDRGSRCRPPGPAPPAGRGCCGWNCPTRRPGPGSGAGRRRAEGVLDGMGRGGAAALRADPSRPFADLLVRQGDKGYKVLPGPQRGHGTDQFLTHMMDHRQCAKPVRPLWENFLECFGRLDPGAVQDLRSQCAAFTAARKTRSPRLFPRDRGLRSALEALPRAPGAVIRLSPSVTARVRPVCSHLTERLVPAPSVRRSPRRYDASRCHRRTVRKVATPVRGTAVRAMRPTGTGPAVNQRGTVCGGLDGLRLAGPEAPADLAWLREVSTPTPWAPIHRRRRVPRCGPHGSRMADGWLGLHALRVDTTTALLRMFRHRDRFGEQRSRHRRTLNSWYWLGWWVQPC